MFESAEDPTGWEVALFLVGWLLMVVSWGFIIHKMRYSGWFFVLFFVPILNIALYLYVAFTRWPIHKEVKALEAKIKELQIKVIKKEKDG